MFHIKKSEKENKELLVMDRVYGTYENETAWRSVYGLKCKMIFANKEVQIPLKTVSVHSALLPLGNVRIHLIPSCRRNSRVDKAIFALIRQPMLEKGKFEFETWKVRWWAWNTIQ